MPTSIAVLPLASAALAAAAVLVAGLATARLVAQRPTRRSLALVGSAVAARAGSPAEREPWLAGLGARLITLSGGQARLDRGLALAGRIGERHTRALASWKAIGLLAGLALGLAWWSMLDWPVAFALVPIAAAAGFWLPDLLLLNAAQRRSEAIRKALPDAIDLLNLCVEAGMGFQAALAQVAATQEGPVAEEFARVLRDTQLGQSRHDALAALAERTTQEDLLRFISAMHHVDRLGIPIAAVLREQAREMRSRRRDRARERAQQVPVKIMLPVVFCFLPVLLGIVIAPAAVEIGRMFSSL